MWTPQQARTFLKTAEQHRLYAAFYLALGTGMRHGEVLGIRWQDIDGDIINVQQAVKTIRGAQYSIGGLKTKSSYRRIAVGPDVVSIFRAHKAKQEAERALLGEAWPGTDLVFTNVLGNVLIPRNFDRIWYNLQKKAGVPHRNFHNLRHFHVSLLVDAGMDPRTVANRIGHTNASITLDIYSHVFEAKHRASAVNLSDMLGGEEDADE